MTREEAIYRLKALLTMCDFRDAFGDRVDDKLYEDAVAMAIEALKAERTGKWIEDRITHRNGCTYRIRRCSECGFVCHYSDDVYGGGYCPNCGSDMRGEEE